jgi:hypothetical protein
MLSPYPTKLWYVSEVLSLVWSFTNMPTSHAAWEKRTTPENSRVWHSNDTFTSAYYPIYLSFLRRIQWIYCHELSMDLLI